MVNNYENKNLPKFGKKTSYFIVAILVIFLVDAFFDRFDLTLRSPLLIKTRTSVTPTPTPEPKKEVMLPKIEIVQEVEAKEPEPTPKAEKVAKVTAYSCGGLETEAEIKMNCPSLLNGRPRTATGSQPVPMRTMACDSANLGRVFYLEGIGEVECTDTGGHIQGAGRFDLYVNDVQEARAFGVKQIKYKLL